MYYLITALLIGTSFAPLILERGSINAWLAQGLFVQVMIGLCFTATFFEKPRNRIPNKPLGLVHGWIMLTTAYFFYLGIVQGKYDIMVFFPYFN